MTGMWFGVVWNDVNALQKKKEEENKIARFLVLARCDHAFSFRCCVIWINDNNMSWHLCFLAFFWCLCFSLRFCWSSIWTRFATFAIREMIHFNYEIFNGKWRSKRKMRAGLKRKLKWEKKGFYLSLSLSRMTHFMAHRQMHWFSFASFFRRVNSNAVTTPTSCLSVPPLHQTTVTASESKWKTFSFQHKRQSNNDGADGNLK